MCRLTPTSSSGQSSVARSAETIAFGVFRFVQSCQVRIQSSMEG